MSESMSPALVSLWALNAAIVATAVLLAFAAGWLFLLTRSAWVIVGFFVIETVIIGFGRCWLAPYLVRRSLEPME